MSAGLLLPSELLQFFLRPVRHTLVSENAEKLMAIPAGFFTVRKAGAANRASTGCGAASETVMGVPKLICGLPAFLAERVR